MKLLIKSKAGQFLSKSFRLQDLSLFIFLNLSKATVGNFRVRERNNGLNLTSQHRPCIPDKCHVVINLFYNFEAMLQKHFHVTMNNPYLTFFAKLTQCWCHVLRSEKTFSIWLRGFSVVMIYCEVKLPSKVEATLSQRYKFDIVESR